MISACNTPYMSESRLVFVHCLNRPSLLFQKRRLSSANKTLHIRYKTAHPEHLPNLTVLYRTRTDATTRRAIRMPVAARAISDKRHTVFALIIHHHDTYMSARGVGSAQKR